MLTKNNARTAVQKYTGGRVTSIEVCPDPNKTGTFAVQAVIDGEPQQFLVENYNEYHTMDALVAKLDEIQFPSWPPYTS